MWLILSVFISIFPLLCFIQSTAAYVSYDRTSSYFHSETSHSDFFHTKKRLESTFQYHKVVSFLSQRYNTLKNKNDDDGEKTKHINNYSFQQHLPKVSSSKEVDSKKLDFSERDTIKLKPRPGRFGYPIMTMDKYEITHISDYMIMQHMSQHERKENLQKMRQIKKNDLVNLRLCKDHAKWIEVNNILKHCINADPWFSLNDQIREAYQLGDEGECKRIALIIQRIGGPPPGVRIRGGKPYAQYTDIYDVGVSPIRTNFFLEDAILEERIQRGRAMASQRRETIEFEKSQRKNKRTHTSALKQEQKEEQIRKERTIKRLFGEIQDDINQRQERAKKVLGKCPRIFHRGTVSLNRVLLQINDNEKQNKKNANQKHDRYPKQSQPTSLIHVDVDGTSLVTSIKHNDPIHTIPTLNNETRLLGDIDITKGEISEEVHPSSFTLSGPISVEVLSIYDEHQSRSDIYQHCFQYTIRIVNNSNQDGIHIFYHRFEIQTVGNHMKDILRCENVTDRKPILPPGKCFQYTSTVLLNIRPVRTTVIAARMEGQFCFTMFSPGSQQDSGEKKTAKVGTFHFIFPDHVCKANKLQSSK